MSNQHRFRPLIRLLPWLTAGALIGCQPVDGGFSDGDGTSDGPTVTLTGSVSAVTDFLFLDVDDVVNDALGGALEVRALRDPDDLDSWVDRQLLTNPGTFSLEVPVSAGAVWLGAVADDGDRLMMTAEWWEAAANPVLVDADQDELQIVVNQLPSRPFRDGTNASEGTTRIAGTVSSSVAGSIAMVARGPGGLVVAYFDGPGPFELYIPDAMVDFNLFVYVDENADGIWNTDERGGMVPHDPDGDLEALVAEVPDQGMLLGVGPQAWVTQTIQVDGAGDGGALRVRLGSPSAGRRLLSETVVDAPGTVEIRLPSPVFWGRRLGTETLTVEVVQDIDGDGVFTPFDEPTGIAGPMPPSELLEDSDITVAAGDATSDFWAQVELQIEFDGPGGDDMYLVAALGTGMTSSFNQCEYAYAQRVDSFPVSVQFVEVLPEDYQLGAYLVSLEDLTRPGAALAYGGVWDPLPLDQAAGSPVVISLESAPGEGKGGPQ